MSGSWGTQTATDANSLTAGHFAGDAATAGVPTVWLAAAYQTATGLNADQLNLFAANSGAGVTDFAGMLTKLNTINGEILTCHNLGVPAVTRRLLASDAVPSSCTCGNSGKLQNTFNADTGTCASGADVA